MISSSIYIFGEKWKLKNSLQSTGKDEKQAVRREDSWSFVHFIHERPNTYVFALWMFLDYKLDSAIIIFLLIFFQ